MVHKFGFSGSVILSEVDRARELFREDLDHIEIGEFQDEASFKRFLALLNESNKTFGIHSPIYRNQSKYDLLEKVHIEPKQAWKQFESEVEHMSKIGAKYVLVHFPYFKEQLPTDKADKTIEEGLIKLNALQEKYKIPIVCEPKLGFGRSAVGIEYLNNFPIELWDKYDLSLCIDIGDYLMAVGEHALKYIAKWKKYIKVVHLHNVEFPEDKYIWVPVHPFHENSKDHFSIREIIKFLAECKDIYFVFEHTPHSKPTNEFVNVGIYWIKELVNAV